MLSPGDTSGVLSGVLKLKKSPSLLVFFSELSGKMKLLILALLVGVCYSAPAAPEMSAGFGTVEQGPEKVENNTLARKYRTEFE